MKTFNFQSLFILLICITFSIFTSCSKSTTGTTAEGTNAATEPSLASSGNDGSTPIKVDLPKVNEAPAPSAPLASTPVSLFEYIYQLEGTPVLELHTDMKSLVRNKMKEKYQPVRFHLKNSEGDLICQLKGKVRARGNMRKQVSYYPPLKIDFVKSELSKLGLLKLDDLKIVLPNNKNKSNKERLLQEYLLYQIYQMMEPTAMEAKLVNVTIKKDGKDDLNLSGLVVEDETAYSARTKSKVLSKGVVRVSQVDRTAFAKMVFFQYMIANTDYSVTKHHNIKMVQWPGNPRLVAVPYDFDYCGFIGHEYALPNPILPIDDVQIRYFFSAYKLSEEEFESTRDYYLSIEQDIYDLCDAASYLDSRTIKYCKNYIEDFYKELPNRSFKQKCTKS